MSIKQAMQAWNGNPVNTGSVSHMRQEGGITGLKLVTDDESVMMQDYIHLQDISNEDDKSVSNLFQAIQSAQADELGDAKKYAEMARHAAFLGREDIALALGIISREEKNHHEILEALLPLSMLKPEALTPRGEPDVMELAERLDSEWNTKGPITEQDALNWLKDKNIVLSKNPELNELRVALLVQYVNSRRDFGWGWGQAKTGKDNDLMAYAERMDNEWQHGVKVSPSDAYQWSLKIGDELSTFESEILAGYVNARRRF